MSDPRLLPPVPVSDPDSDRFWSSLSEGRLEMCRCSDCRTWLQPPLERCRKCAGPTAFELVSGHGKVFSHIVVRHPSIPGFTPPYVVAMVEFDEDSALRITGVLDIDPETSSDKVAIGLPVSAEIREIGESGINAIFFAPLGEDNVDPSGKDG